MPDSKRLSRVRVWTSHCVALSAAALTGWGLFLVGALSLLDHVLYDRCLSIATTVRETPADVVLVTTSAETLASDDQRRRLVTALDGLEAKGIAFTQPVTMDAPPFVDTPGAAWVIIPERFHDPTATADAAGSFSPGPPAASCDVGFVPAPDGVYRSQQMVFFDRQGHRRSLEAAIAETWFGGEWSRPGDRFYIRFQAGGESLPMVPAEVVLNDGLVPELVRGRMVLIGPERSLGSPGLSSPVSGGVPMSPLEFHGHAVNSLLTQTWISVPPLPLVLVIVALCSATTYALCVRFPQQRRRLVAMLLVMELCGGWIALTFAGVWFPVGLLWGGQALGVLACSAHSRWQFRDLTNRLAFQVRSSLPLRQETRPSADANDPWKELGDFIRQLIPVSELAVYELTGRRRRSRRQKYVWRNGAGADGELDESVIGAARAALDRLSANMDVAPVRLSGDQFAYAARLRTCSGTLGEMILVPHPEAELPREVLEAQVRMLLDTIKQRTRTGVTGNSHLPGPADHAGQPTPGDSANGLCDGLDRLRFEFGLLEHVFDEIGTGLALYDASGTRVRANRCFRTYLSDRVGDDPAPALAELLASLLSNAADVRQNLRQLLLRKSPVTLTVPGRTCSREDHVRLRPIEFRWSSPLASINDATVFRIQLVTCEWNRPESHGRPEFDGTSDLMAMVESLQGIVSGGGGRRPFSVPEASAEPVHA